MTGKDDYISNGEVAYKLSNGSELLGRNTGGGCMVGGVEDGKQQPSENARVGGDMLLATIAGSVHRTISFHKKFPEGILMRAGLRRWL